VIALKTFSESFGITGTPTEVAILQGNVVSILQGGAFFGALGGGPVEERIGRKYALMVGCVIFIVGGIVQVAATNGISAGQFWPAMLSTFLTFSLWWSVHCGIRSWTHVGRSVHR